jgi:hypothetical protein
LECLEHVCWLGGPLATSTGDLIVKSFEKAVLWQIYGSTEMAWPSMLIPAREKWQYLEFHPTIGPNLELVEGTECEGEIYEYVGKPSADESMRWVQPIFELFPEICE